jgi:hypothetical protein
MGESSHSLSGLGHNTIRQTERALVGCLSGQQRRHFLPWEDTRISAHYWGYLNSASGTSVARFTDP